MNSNNRILVVDDNPAIHSDFNKILTPKKNLDSSAVDLFLGTETTSEVQCNYELTSAFQGLQGVEAATQAIENGEPFAMAFVDMRMPPGLDGLETIKRLWQIDKSIQIVICTAFSDISWQDLQNELGKTDSLLILKKPFDSAEVNQLAVALTEKWRLQKDLKSALQRALIASEAKSRFVATMSHELRTPLNGVLGMTRLLEATDLTDQQRSYLNACRTSGESLQNVIGNILDFSKIEAGKSCLDLTPTNLLDLLEGVAQSVAVDLMKSRPDVDLTCSVDPEVPLISADAGKLQQLFFNLVGNAAKFTESGSIVISAHTKSATKDQTEIEFSIRDTGIGIAPNQLKTIFEPFKQADGSTTRKYEGTGLGLSICQQIVELMGGEPIAVESEVGNGSTFSFALTFEQIEDQATKQLKDFQNAPTPESLGLDHPIRVLLVEDNDINQMYAEKLFEASAFEYKTCSDGQQAIDLVHNDDNFDIILMDCQMPVMDGIEAATVITRLARDKKIRDIPIVALTANAVSTAQEECFQAGMKDYLTKPYAIEDLYGAINRCLGAQSNDQEGTGPAKGIGCEEQDSQVGIKAPLNFDTLMKRMQNNEKIASILLKGFEEALTSYYDDFSDLSDTCDLEQVKAAAHKLKGSASTVSAEAIVTVAKRLEEAAKAEDTQKVKQQLQLMTKEMDRFLEWTRTNDLESQLAGR